MSEQAQQQLQNTLNESRELALENYRLRKSAEKSNSINRELMEMVTDFFELEPESRVTVNEVRELFQKAKDNRKSKTSGEVLPES